MTEPYSKLFDDSSVFIGIKKASNGEHVLSFTSLSESTEEVKNKIYYKIEQANMQFNLETAWKTLSQIWTIVGCKLKRAEGFDVQKTPGAPFEIVQLFIGVKKEEGTKRIVLDSAAPSIKETWDKIYYKVEKATASLKREDAEKRMSNVWDVWEFRLIVPLPDKVKIDKIMID